MERALAALNEPQAFRFVERKNFPETLESASWKSPVLFYDGNASALNFPKVGIVGTRSATTYGKACAFKFAEVLAQAGVSIVSGGALGNDASAHQGALEAGGTTIAVLGGGIDNPQPSVNRPIFDRIRERGLLLSQFEIGCPVSNHTLLGRNKLIAALSDILIVIEAPAKSGALHTANDANELGRPVFVVPANIDQHSFRGSFGLIRDGATVVTHPDEILEMIGVVGQSVQSLPVEANSLAGLILAQMSAQGMSAQTIVERTGIEAPLVLSELTMLELEGRIIRDAGGYAIKL